MSEWTNRSTEAAGLWLSNTESHYNRFMEQKAAYVAEIDQDEANLCLYAPKPQALRHRLAAFAEGYVSVVVDIPNLDGLANELLTASVQSIDWNEIADLFIDGDEWEDA